MTLRAYSKEDIETTTTTNNNKTKHIFYEDNLTFKNHHHFVKGQEIFAIFLGYFPKKIAKIFLII